jgi:hypothetical protein
VQVQVLLLLAGWPFGSGYGVSTRTTSAEQLPASGTGAGGARNWTSGWPKRRREPGPVPNPTEPWWLNDAPLQVRGTEGHTERQRTRDGLSTFVTAHAD